MVMPPHPPSALWKCHQPVALLPSLQRNSIRRLKRLVPPNTRHWLRLIACSKPGPSLTPTRERASATLKWHLEHLLWPKKTSPSLNNTCASLCHPPRYRRLNPRLPLGWSLCAVMGLNNLELHLLRPLCTEKSGPLDSARAWQPVFRTRPLLRAGNKRGLPWIDHRIRNLVHHITQGRQLHHRGRLGLPKIAPFF